MTKGKFLRVVDQLPGSGPFIGLLLLRSQAEDIALSGGDDDALAADGDGVGDGAQFEAGEFGAAEEIEDVEITVHRADQDALIDHDRGAIDAALGGEGPRFLAGLALPGARVLVAAACHHPFVGDCGGREERLRGAFGFEVPEQGLLFPIDRKKAIGQNADSCNSAQAALKKIRP